MTTIECPICDERLDADALLGDGEARCESCTVFLELAADDEALAAAA